MKRRATIGRRWWPALAAVVALGALAGPAAALAHPGAPLAPHDLWLAWNADPPIVLGLLLALWLYGQGVQALWRRAGPGHGTRPVRVAYVLAGTLALVLALLSPLDALADTLFAAHMVQHLVLMLVAAPLLVLGEPLLPALWALRPLLRRGGARPVGALFRGLRSRWCLPLAWALLSAALWAWHMPALYQAALENEAVHALEHGCFLGAALLFWWAVAHPRGGPRGYGFSLLAVFTIGMQNAVLGALLTFSPVLWYPAYGSRAGLWSLTPLGDQQLAGLIMWVPASVVFLCAVAVLFVRWLAAVERMVRRREMPGAWPAGAEPAREGVAP